MKRESKLMDRLDIESYGQMLLAARCGAYRSGHEHGVSDAAMGRVFSSTRATFDDRAEYDLGYRVGRFLLYRGLPKWRAPMLTHSDAAELWPAFLASPDARPGDPE